MTHSVLIESICNHCRQIGAELFVLYVFLSHIFLTTNFCSHHDLKHYPTGIRSDLASGFSKTKLYSIKCCGVNPKESSLMYFPAVRPALLHSPADLNLKDWCLIPWAKLI